MLIVYKMLPLPFQLYIALMASFNFPRVFIPKGQICPSCDSTDKHQSVFDTIIMLLQFKQKFPIQFLPSHKGPLLSAAVKCSTKHKYLCSLLWFTAMQTTVTSPCVPMAVCLLLGGFFFGFNIASDCFTLSLGSICTRFCTTNTAKPVSIFFLSISPSGTFTLTQNESPASQSFLIPSSVWEMV